MAAVAAKYSALALWRSPGNSAHQQWRNINGGGVAAA
jgi:hypothetical protein